MTEEKAKREIARALSECAKDAESWVWDLQRDEADALLSAVAHIKGARERALQHRSGK